jgi:hypothetical protein
MPSSREISVNWVRSLRAGRSETLGIDAHQHGARHLLGGAYQSGGARRLQAADELFPRVGIAQKLAGHFHENGVVREPEIGRRGGQDVVLFVHLAGQRFRFGAGLHHSSGFGAAGFTHQENRGQFAQLGILLLLRHRQPRLGLCQQFVEIGDFFRRFGRGAAFRARLLVPPGHDEGYNGGRDDTQDRN